MKLDHPTKERWQELCEQAAIEQDPVKMLALCAEINRILEAKEKRLQSSTNAETDGGGKA